MDSTTPRVTASAGATGSRTAPGIAPVTADTTIMDVINHPAFTGFGRFLFPTGSGMPSPSLTVRNANQMMTYHTHVEVSTTLDVITTLLARVDRGETIFYDIYTEAQKAADPSKRDTGLFLIRGEKNAPFGIINAGGAFSYVASIHESLPHALELSRQGFNGFALQYRTGGAQVAYEDLAAAISFVFRNADALGVSTAGYSLWGGSAGARMAASLGSYGPKAYGGDDVPRPSTVVMQYTGHTDWTRQDPATFVVVGENDGIASWRTMKSRVDTLAAAGIATEFHVYPNLGHGFGLGLGTSAEGWIDDAIRFWKAHR